jgi:hypothetical protein
MNKSGYREHNSSGYDRLKRQCGRHQVGHWFERHIKLDIRLNGNAQLYHGNAQLDHGNVQLDHGNANPPLASITHFHLDTKYSAELARKRKKRFNLRILLRGGQIVQCYEHHMKSL